MNQPLANAIAAMGDAVNHEQPTMFWGEAMKHVRVLLEHLQTPLGASAALTSTRISIAEGRPLEAVQHLDQVLLHLQAQSSEHVIHLADLLVAFESALSVKPFLWLEIGYNRVSGWMVTVYDKAAGTERVIVQVQSYQSAGDASIEAAQQLLAHIKEESHD